MALFVLQALAFTPPLGATAGRAVVRGQTVSMSAPVEASLLRLCALTDRGQRCTPGDRARIASLIAELEAEAPDADADRLNGRWRLVYGSEGSVYRSSPFFWAFQQAAKALTTPIGIPSGNVQAGDSIASAILAITDAIPFYDVGSATQEILGVKCLIECAPGPPSSTSDGASAQDEPSDGTSDWRSSSDVPQLTSRVELSIDRLFGLPAQTSVMTTTAQLRQPDPAEAAEEGRVLELELAVQTTSAAQSTIASLLPPLASLLENFPSGRALEAAAPGAATVRLSTTYLSDGLRISKPLLEGVAGEQAVFVYVRDEDAAW